MIISRTRIQWFGAAAAVFCVIFKQFGVLVRAEKRMASFPEGSVFTRLSFCLFVLLATALLLKISDLQVEISLGSSKNKMIFYLFPQYSFVRRFCFWNFKNYPVNSKNILTGSAFLIHKMP